MRITDKVVINTPYAILKVTSSNRVMCEYFSEYPDAKLSTLLAMDFATMKENGIASFAVCAFCSPVWQIEQLRGVDPNSRKVIIDYVAHEMNESYTQTKKNNVSEG